MEDPNVYRQALEDFRRARSKAAMQRFWAGIKGRSLDLLPYDEISTKLRAVSRTDRGVKQVPLKDIIGSVNRIQDFDRNFLPLRDDDIHRWAGVKTAMTSPLAKGVPPVSLYQIGNAYFVLDGNHRVSIAKEMGMETIEAYVTEIKTKVPVPSTLTSDELILKTAYVDFLEDTQIDQILPGFDFSLHLVENYPLLKEHISVHQYYMGIENDRPVSFEEAVLDWYETLYSPVVASIESSGLHHAFRDLTLTDLYLWLLDQQQSLQQDLGITLKHENVLDYAADQEGIKHEYGWSTAEEQIMQVLLKGNEQPQNPYQDCLFQHITVALSQDDPDWIALEQAIYLNRCSGGAIRGVHVENPSGKKVSKDIDCYQQRFDQRLAQAGMTGKFFLRQGEPASALLEFSLLSDLLVLNLNYPPAANLMDRISHGIITILQQSRRPVLFVKEDPLPVSSILLPFDGGQRSKEALFVAAYYAARYGCPLHLLLVTKGSEKDEVNRYYAQTYLERLEVKAEYHQGTSESFTADVVSLAETLSVSTLILGGYENTTILDRVFSQSIDEILAKVSIPVMICQ
jgi:nucleotide-binding universal stress UspA family protein/ribosome modulation factor